ncbi:hypothetical protein M3Y94_00995900 [Aphelenchoides besseyi]|nr:hypothetical protein M3Y94_00995900 [Aphelenchoides besseyi]
MNVVEGTGFQFTGAQIGHTAVAVIIDRIQVMFNNISRVFQPLTRTYKRSANWSKKTLTITLVQVQEVLHVDQVDSGVLGTGELVINFNRMDMATTFEEQLKAIGFELFGRTQN